MGAFNQDDLSRLTPPERLALIEQLWDSIESDQLPLTAAQQTEFYRRLETLDDDRRRGAAWPALRVEPDFCV
ncbi:MAG TPA: addiction module protein [Terracidiphilus sp.]|nr:addiction module protein [Terracidiphilus sp.]